MDKQLYFLAGVHRSGNTLLSSILNQHPDIYSSPLGPMCEYMWLVHSSNHESTVINTYDYRKKQLISNMHRSYYADVKKPVIIDREKNWGHPENLKMLKAYLPEKPKIIYTTRPIAEVLASLIAINKYSIEKEIAVYNWKFDSNLSHNDNLCEYLMHPGNQLMRNLEAIASIKDKDNAGIFHVVEYKDITGKSQETMDKIYEFLGVDKFNNDFNNIKKIEEYNDEAAGLAKDLHAIRPTISKGSVVVEDYVSQYIKDKYAYIDNLSKE